MQAGRPPAEFLVETEVDGTHLRWEAVYDPHLRRTVWERVSVADTPDFEHSETFLEFENGRLSEPGQVPVEVEHPFEGSILSNFPSERGPALIWRLREEVLSIRSMDPLDPRDLRRCFGLHGNVVEAVPDGRARPDGLAALLCRLGPAAIQEKLLPILQAVFPTVVDVRTVGRRGARVDVEVVERFGKKELVVPASQCGDGLRRVAAVAAQLTEPKGLLCWDEIENGVSMDAVPALMKCLRNSNRQVLLTTHSLLVMNYIESEHVWLVARDERSETCVGRVSELETFRVNADFCETGDAVYFATLQALSEELVRTSRANMLNALET